MTIVEARCPNCNRLFFLDPGESEGALCCICKRDHEYETKYGPDWRKMVRVSHLNNPSNPTPPERISKPVRGFLSLADRQFNEPISALANDGQEILDQLGLAIKRSQTSEIAREGEHPRMVSLLVSLVRVVEELRRYGGYLSQLGVTKAVELAFEDADFLWGEFQQGLSLTGISMDEVETMKLKSPLAEVMETFRLL